MPSRGASADGALPAWHQLAAWAEKSLDGSTRAELAACRERAFDDLAETLATEPPAATAIALGVPSARHARGMLRALRGALAGRV